MENNGNKGSKAAGILQKLFRFRLKIDRKGTPIVNVSSIFALACLIFAPHMSIVGVVASLLLGYHINLESDDNDTELEERIRNAAANVRTTAKSVTRTIQTEINRARTENQANAQNAQNTQAAPVQQAVPAMPTNQEIMQDLEKHAEEFAQSTPNPAATTFHSAYSASAASVPTLHVEEQQGEEPSAPASSAHTGI